MVKHNTDVSSHLPLDNRSGLTSLKSACNVWLKVDNWCIFHINLFVELLLMMWHFLPKITHCQEDINVTNALHQSLDVLCLGLVCFEFQLSGEALDLIKIVQVHKVILFLFAFLRCSQGQLQSILIIWIGPLDLTLSKRILILKRNLCLLQRQLLFYFFATSAASLLSLHKVPILNTKLS